MKRLNLLIAIFPFVAIQTLAQAKPPPPVAKLSPALTLKQYLEQVRTQSPAGRALVEAVTMTELRLEEAEVPLSSELY
ncbi:MAG TPA: hypothetical protein PKC28_04145, partial [Bdellovibrionales bacterium]|nr:hypothetical protein [Bdellovibrionales bacterium]